MMPDTKNPFATARIVGKGVDPATYHAQKVERGHKDYVMSRSELCEFMHCAKRWRDGYQRKDTDATEFGTLMDALLLDADNFEKRFAVEPATYPADGGKDKKWNNNATYCKEWTAEQEAAEKTVVSGRLYNDAQRAVSVLLAAPDIYELITRAQKQVHVVGEYHDNDTGLKIPVQALLDIVPDRDGEFGLCLVDFKTAVSAFPFVWQRSVFEKKYHWQAAMHMDLYGLAAVADPQEREGYTFLHLIQESYFPWTVGRRWMSSEFVKLGRLKVIEALRLYAACLHANHWPSYDAPGKSKMDLTIGGETWGICDVESWMEGRQ